MPEAVKKELITQRQNYKRAKATVASLYSQGYQFNSNGTVASGVTHGTQHLGFQQPFDNRSIGMVSTAQPQAQYFIPPLPPAQHAPPIQEVQIQQVQQGTGIQPAGGTIMGGRNEQAKLKSRSIKAVNTKRRKLAAASSLIQVEYEPQSIVHAANKMDSNADTCCLGPNFVILSHSNRFADVYAYDTSLEPTHNVPIVTGATTYLDPTTRRSYLLIINEGLYYGTKLDHSLINPNQIRDFGIEVWDNPYDKSHDVEINVDDELQISLSFKGTKGMFHSSTPSTDDLQWLPRIVLTSDKEWNPHDIELGIQSLLTNICEPIGQVVGETNQGGNYYGYVDPTSNDSLLHQIDPSLADLDTRIISALTHQDLPVRPTLVSTERHNNATVSKLSEMWGIGINKAAATMKVTTQRGKRSALLPLSRRYRANRIHGMRRLNGKFATDTLFSDIKSLN